MQGWPVDIQECIKMTPLSSFSRGVIWDRWSIPFMTPQQEMNGVTLAGLICFIRDNIALPFMFRASAVLGHSKYDCGQLPSPP
jgi:hypothetical protein